MGRSALIVGGDSLIARALLALLGHHGFSVCRTSRKEGEAGPNVVVLRLARGNSYDVLKGRSFDVAILCAGVTSLQACRRDPDASREVNVVQTVELAKRLAGAGAFVVHLSTNLVFDGMRPTPAEDAAVCPSTEYGRQKAEAEAGLKELGPDVGIIRMTKLLHQASPPAVEWLRELRAGQPVCATCDVPASVLDFRQSATGIALVASKRAAGIWHFSNSEDTTYFRLAGGLARHLGIKPNLVRAVAWADTLGSAEHRPAFAALGTPRTSRELGLVFDGPEGVTRSLAGISPP